MFFAVICAIILFFIWIYFEFLYKPLFYSAKNYFVNDFGNNVNLIRNEALATLSTPTLPIPRGKTMWSGAVNVKEYIQRVNDAGPGWVTAWTANNEPNAQWLNFPLMVDGQLFEKNAVLCPTTSQLLLQHKDRINVAGFSLLQPMSKIPTHTDNTGVQFGSLAYHLGLDVPHQQCNLIVNGKEVIQNYGKQIVFDSTFPHSAENKSNLQRTILYIDFKV